VSKFNEQPSARPLASIVIAMLGVLLPTVAAFAWEGRLRGVLYIGLMGASAVSAFVFTFMGMRLLRFPANRYDLASEEIRHVRIQSVEVVGKDPVRGAISPADDRPSEVNPSTGPHGRSS